MFDKVSSRSRRIAIRDAGSENNFNAVELDDGKLNLEVVFAALKSPWMLQLKAYRRKHRNLLTVKMSMSSNRSLGQEGLLLGL